MDQGAQLFEVELIKKMEIRSVVKSLLSQSATGLIIVPSGLVSLKISGSEKKLRKKGWCRKTKLGRRRSLSRWEL